MKSLTCECTEVLRSKKKFVLFDNDPVSNYRHVEIICVALELAGYPVLTELCMLCELKSIPRTFVLITIQTRAGMINKGSKNR